RVHIPLKIFRYLPDSFHIPKIHHLIPHLLFLLLHLHNTQQLLHSYPYLQSFYFITPVISPHFTHFIVSSYSLSCITLNFLSSPHLSQHHSVILNSLPSNYTFFCRILRHLFYPLST